MSSTAYTSQRNKIHLSSNYHEKHLAIMYSCYLVSDDVNNLCFMLVIYIDLRLQRLLTLLHSERPKLYTILAFLSAVGFNT